MAFVERRLEVSIKLAANTLTNQPNVFAASGTDTVTLRNLRTSVQVQNSGSPSGSRATVKVWGLAPSTMNQLSTLGLSYNVVPLNTITIKAGSLPTLFGSTGGMAVLYSGTIQNGYADYNGMPDVPFIISANSGLGDSVAPCDPTSFTGSTSIATIFSGFARQMNRGFENNGVTGTLSNPYYAGNIYQQMQQAAEEARIIAEVVNGNVLAIWPRGGYRTTQTNVPVISELNDSMIGAPAFTQSGIIIKAVFDPLISFGALVQVRSSVLDGVVAAQSAFNRAAPFRSPTDSRWAVSKLDHALDAEMPGGQWMSTIAAYNPNYARPVSR